MCKGNSIGLCIFLLFMVVQLSTCFIVNSRQKPLKIASFNIRHFGRGLMSDDTVAERIAEICERYDVVFIMETRDATGSALNDLWSLLNKTDAWGLVQSAPIGRTSYKEQYVYFYRSELAMVMGTYQVPDAQDVYEREPFGVEFKFWSVSNGETRRVSLLGLHAKPSDVKGELEELPATVRSVASHFHSADGVIAIGDFNADCRYASTSTQENLEIFNSTDFTSLIPGSADTAVSSHSNCAYDRVVVYGSKVDARYPQVYNYWKAMNLTFDEAWDISDHFPVEFQLY